MRFGAYSDFILNELYLVLESFILVAYKVKYSLL